MNGSPAKGLLPRHTAAWSLLPGFGGNRKLLTALSPDNSIITEFSTVVNSFFRLQANHGDKASEAVFSCRKQPPAGYRLLAAG